MTKRTIAGSGFIGMAAALAFISTAAALYADVRLPHVIGDNMVLQREMTVPIWGWADPGEEVTVKLGEQSVSTKAGDEGRWTVRLASMPAGGPFEMTVSGKNTIQLTNVLVGEVWLASGQSNMAFTVGNAIQPKREIAQADYPKIRLMVVPRVPAGMPADDVNVRWLVCNPENVGAGFSAAAYFFGRMLHKELNVPIGLIDSSWGGTRIEPWTPEEAFTGFPEFKDISEKILRAKEQYKKSLPGVLDQYEAWMPKARRARDANESIPTPPEWPQHPLASHQEPTGLYNGMIHPLVPFAIRGAIWYQGESNCGDGLAYTNRMKAMIAGWRKVWGEGDFPFYYVQIAPFSKAYSQGKLPLLWEAQTAAMAIPNTGMIVTTDIANLDDIHPKNKQDVGKRLALWALAKTYGHKDLVYSGPLFKSMKIEDGKIRLSFDHVGGGLASSDGKPLSWFLIAGEDHKFVPAEAVIDGSTVVVSSDKVAAPVAVRLGWKNVAQPNLINKEGLPASPFRTDRW